MFLTFCPIPSSYEDRVVFKLGLCDRYQVRLFLLNLQRISTSGFAAVVELLLKLLKVAVFHIHGKNFLKASYLDVSFWSHHSDTLPTDA